MKVLMISTDSNIFDQKSKVRRRMMAYGQFVDRLDIVVLSGRNYKTEDKLNEKVTAYATNSRVKLGRLMDAWKLGKQFSPEIITCQDPLATGLIGYCLKKKFKVPLELQMHTDIFDNKFKFFSLGNYFKYLLAKKILVSADKIRVVSNRIKLNLLSSKINLKAKIIVLPIFVDLVEVSKLKKLSNEHNLYPQFKKIILITSRLTSEKNIKLAIEGFKLVQKDRKDTGLLIAGSGPVKNKLEKVIKKLKLEDSVVFLGWQNDLISFYQTADVFLQTSNFEGYGLALAEAMAFGLPAVSTDVGVAREAGALICSFRPEGVALALKQAIDEPTQIKFKVDNLNQITNFNDYVSQIVTNWQVS